MFQKKLTEQEMEEKISLFLEELRSQCSAAQCWEFDYYCEVWGVWWMPWFIEIDQKNLQFTANSIYGDELDFLLGKGYIELIKEYDQSEMTGESGRTRYRLIQ